MKPEYRVRLVPAVVYSVHSNYHSGNYGAEDRGGTVTGRRLVVLIAALGLVGALFPAAATARSQQEQPAASEIGVTPDTIRIAVIADVDNAARPGLFQGSVNGVRAAAKFINDSGGVAGGREIQGDVIHPNLVAGEGGTRAGHA